MATQDHTDPFDTLLTLEDSLYSTAYAAGVADGARAGRIEGRVFGLEKGFEKFLALGTLQGRAAVWGARVAAPSTTTPQGDVGTRNTEEAESTLANEEKDDEKEEEEKDTNTEFQKIILPPLPSNPRLEKHISMLYGLTEPDTFSTENTEEAVADFDDRVKRAGAKAKVIERLIGEHDGGSGSPERDENGTEVKSPKSSSGVRRKMKLTGEGKKDDSMEDFAGGKLLL